MTVTRGHFARDPAEKSMFIYYARDSLKFFSFSLYMYTFVTISHHHICSKTSSTANIHQPTSTPISKLYCVIHISLEAVSS